MQQALKARPDYAEAHFNTGSAMQSRGDAVGAAASFKEAIRIRPSYARAYFHLGQVHELLRRDYDAQACYEAAVRLEPEAAEMQRRLGDLLVIKRNSGAEFRCQTLFGSGIPVSEHLFAWRTTTTARAHGRCRGDGK